MKDTVSERTATAAELAAEAVRLTPCPSCDARRGYSCDGKGGMHLSRWAAAHQDGGQVTCEVMTAVFRAVVPVFADTAIVSPGDL